MVTATQLVGPVIAELERTVVAELTQFMQSSGLAAEWKSAGLTARDLAQHLHAASYGVKHQVQTLDEYRDRMQVAVRIVCRGPAGTRATCRSTASGRAR